MARFWTCGAGRVSVPQQLAWLAPWIRVIHDWAALGYTGNVKGSSMPAGASASAEITRAECRQRARLLGVRSYDVVLDLTRDEEVFGSVSVVRFDCAEPGAASHADLVADAVHEITLNGGRLDPAAVWSGGRIALPALAARNELRVVADCRYTGSGTGMHRSAGGDDGGTYIYGKLAQAYARTAYACFDQPDLTQQWWDDLWLSESFADFCEYHARSRLGRSPDVWSTFSVNEKARAFADDQLPSAHPVASDATTLSEAIANFDQISYAKGASVLRQLAGYAGEQEFFAGLRGYLTRHAYGNARLADLIDAVARGFIQPEHGDLLACYAGRYLAAIEDIWASSSGHQRVQLGALLFPYPAASPELLTMIEQFLTAVPRDPALARLLRDHQDTTQRALRSRALT